MKSQRRIRSALVVALLIALPTYLVAIALSKWMVMRNTPSENSCLNILRQIDGAKQQWAVENQITNDCAVSWEDLLPYMGKIGEKAPVPRCPQGGNYQLGRARDIPTCSVPGHKIN